MSIATETFRIEPVLQRVRAIAGGHVVLDTTDARLVFEPRRAPRYAFHLDAIDASLLRETAAGEEDGARRWSIKVGDRVIPDAVVAYHNPDHPEIDDLVVVRWDAMDHWFEEDQEVFVHAKNPCHRVDAYPSSRHVEVYADGVKVADTSHPIIVYETDMPPRYYIPKLDVRMDLLEKVQRQTGCPYKGYASYYSLDAGDRVHRMRVWEYERPLPEARTIAGHLAFYQEKLEVYVDGKRA